MADPRAKVKPNRLVQRNPRKKEEGKVNTYRAQRYLKINGERRAPGELVPEAHTWFRVGNSEHTGFIKNEQVSESEFDEAVQKYCPDLADRLEGLAKGKQMAEKDEGPRGFTFDEDGAVVDVAARRRLAREREAAQVAPNDRAAADGSLGTPAEREEQTPDHIHSDGGPTLWSEKGLGGDGWDGDLDAVEENDKGVDAGAQPRGREHKAASETRGQSVKNEIKNERAEKDKD
jgi:hypothetical protein